MSRSSTTPPLSLALAGRGLDLRIVVVDNDGGGIFSFLPQRRALEEARFEQLFGTPHGTDLVALAVAHHLPASDAVTVADVASFAGGSGPALLRVRLDRDANVSGLRGVERRRRRSPHDPLTARLHRFWQRSRPRRARSLPRTNGQGRTMAPSMACSLAWVSASSASGTLSATMPPPATRRAWRRSALSSAHRIVTAQHPDPEASTQPTAPPYRPRDEALDLVRSGRSRPAVDGRRAPVSAPGGGRARARRAPAG